MKLYKFWGMGRVAALTSDHTGHNLPESHAPWVAESTVDVSEDNPERIGSSSAEILRAIESEGYIVLRPDDQDASGAHGTP